MTLRVTVAVAAAALGSLVPPIMALGSCVAGPELGIAVRQAEVAFVGTVTSTQGEGRWATVLVEEVWAGPDQPATVVVVGAVDPRAITSVDRSFTVGTRYLFVPQLGDNGSLTDTSCSATTEWAEALAALRPAVVRAPIGSTPAGDIGPAGIVVPIGVALAVAVALLLIGLAARSRQAV